MKHFLILFGVILLSSSSWAQKKNKFDINTPEISGANGENLWVVIDSSYKASHFFSEFYIDSLSRKPYSGVLTIEYNGHSVDSIHVINGYRDGISCNYHLKDTVILTYFEYLSQGDGTCISRNYPCKFGRYATRNKYNSLWIRFFSGDDYVRIHAMRKRNFIKVVVKQRDRESKFHYQTIGPIDNLLLSYAGGDKIVALLNYLGAYKKFEITRSML